MDKPTQNIQDSFLNGVRKEKTHVTIYLMSGVKLSGKIKSFDKYSLILESNAQEQLIFKHAISTVVTAKTSAFPSSPSASATAATGGGPGPASLGGPSAPASTAAEAAGAAGAPGHPTEE